MFLPMACLPQAQNILKTLPIAQIQIPKMPQQFNVNSRTQHDITVRLESMSDEELEKIALLAQLEQDGVLLIDQQDFNRIEDEPRKTELEVVNENS